MGRPANHQAASAATGSEHPAICCGHSDIAVECSTARGVARIARLPLNIPPFPSVMPLQPRPPAAGTRIAPLSPDREVTVGLRFILLATHPAHVGAGRARSYVRHEMDADLRNWFSSAILPHQAALRRYLRRVCRSSSEVPDLVQETLVRVYESSTKSRPRFPKQFLFTTARNLFIDKLRRERVVSIDYTPETISPGLAIDELSPERRLAALQELQHLTRALESLPERTRSVIWLRRVAGISQRETAAILGIAESALEGHMTRGMRSLRAIVVDG